MRPDAPGRGQEFEDEATFLVSKPVWPQGFNITGVYTSGTGHIVHFTA